MERFVRCCFGPLLTLMCWLVVLSGTVRGADVDRPATALRVSPDPIRLGGANRRQQLRITAIDPAGRQFDVTHHCSLESADGSLVAIEGTALRAVANGRTTLRVRYGLRQASVPVVVAGVDTFPPVHFLNDIMPIFSKLGCNSGGCHGRQSGQNGFKLSVFGHDPQADYNALVKEARGRRVSLATPGGSLLVAKATGQVPHGGGV